MEAAISFLSGALSAFTLAFVFSFKTKGFFRLTVNLICGMGILAVLSLAGVIPFDALNAFIVGALGVPGLIAIIIAAAVL